MATLPVLNFHDITPARRDGGFPVRLFGHFLRSLHGQGFRTVDLAEAVEQLNLGKDLPEKSVAITFDDGYRSVHRYAFPLLLELEYTATLFIVTGEQCAARKTLPPQQNREMMRWEELEELLAAGMSVGSHSVSHPDLRKVSTEQLISELVVSKRILEERFAVGIRSFAYPFGKYDERVRNMVLAHYEDAFSDHLDVMKPSSDRYGLPRIDMTYFNRAPLPTIVSSPVLSSYLDVRRFLHRWSWKGPRS